jgi:lipopolysaccharide export system protein LptC
MGMREVSIVLVLASAVGCSSPRSTAGVSAPPQVILYGARVHSFEGDRLVMTGRAAKLGYERGGGAFYASEVFMRFPREREVPSSPRPFGVDPQWVEIRAPWMVGSQAHQTVEGTDGIAIRTSAGVVATAQRALYERGPNRATGRGVVEIEGPGYWSQGRSFVFDFGSDMLELEHEVETQIGSAP